MPLTTITGMQDALPLVSGGIVNTLPHKSHTCLNAAADIDPALKGIPFGRGVTVAALPVGQTYKPYDRLQVAIAANAPAKFAGVAQFTDAVVGNLTGNPDDYTSPRGYLPNRELAVVFEGCVGVDVNGPVTPASPVFVVYAAGADHGKFRADAGTSTAVAVPGAVFRGSAAAGGVVALELNIDI